MEQNDTPHVPDLTKMSELMRQVNLIELLKRNPDAQVLLDGKIIYAEDVGKTAQEIEMNRIRRIQDKRGNTIGQALEDSAAYERTREVEAAQQGKRTPKQQESDKIFKERINKRALEPLSIGGTHDVDSTPRQDLIVIAGRLSRRGKPLLPGRK